MYRFNVQVPDRGVVRSRDPLQFGAPIISLERLNLKLSGYISSSNSVMAYHPQKGCGYGHVTV